MYYYYLANTNDITKKITIGEDDLGCAFVLYVSEDIPDLQAWQAKWEVPDSGIVDSLGVKIFPEDMLAIITYRWYDGDEEFDDEDGTWKLKSHNLIHTVVGRNGCIKQESTWDLIKCD